MSGYGRGRTEGRDSHGQPGRENPPRTSQHHPQLHQTRASKGIQNNGGWTRILPYRAEFPANVQQGIHKQPLDAQPPSVHSEIAVVLAHRLEDLVQRYGQELGSVREELGAERVRREQAEEKAARLEAKLEALREAQDAPETASEGGVGTETPTSDTEEPRRSSWWRRWFFGLE